MDFGAHLEPINHVKKLRNDSKVVLSQGSDLVGGSLERR